MLKVVKYHSELKEEWDQFIETSKNGSFLLMRDFIEYHANRFVDASAMVFDGQKLLMVLPANGRGNREVGSHDGLTYGGCVFRADIKLPLALSAISAAMRFYHESGLDLLDLKLIPRFYHTRPADEVDYAMWLCGAELYRRDSAFVIDQDSRIPVAKNYSREAKKAKACGYFVQEEVTCERFWEQILVPNLKQRFGVSPVHSLEEIEYLRNHFPEHIRCFTACADDGQPVSGALMFLSNNVAHAQYISGTELGRSSGALNMLFVDLIDDVFGGCRYFDFGIANEKQGRALNYGLASWKERMGGRTVVHDFYRIKTNRWKAIEDVSCSV